MKIVFNLAFLLLFLSCFSIFLISIFPFRIRHIGESLAQYESELANFEVSLFWFRLYCFALILSSYTIAAWVNEK